MTDKVQKIREEVERLKLCTMDEHMKFYSEAAEAEYNALCNIEHFIDSLQEEPVSEDLGEYINELSKQFPEVSFAKLSRIAVRVAKWQKEHLWKPADGDDLPEIDREVIVLCKNGRVSFGHRPVEKFIARPFGYGRTEEYEVNTFDKGGWNIPNVKYWLDTDLPNMEG